ncbi:tRNA pseudouridine55 synthase [Anaerosolibacter carboniphilus]|uniref:tRNA pseudouridine synthase B n=1 Tax=Anaerosolibacter carboniphilus TaxID=1417629 RepID=A0A841L2E1_9FIRM|nr:tRNA pseudouridine(55) synthase TruB [Anaerosolibacter carboniphilus]MBB6216525.1 tRNA pseudouridine55 synthase [Anaerosolibacter carboniphilus]
MDGIINILKPPKMTSHDVVYVVRKTLNMKKVGHTGTLDPMAAGVLPVCLGKATRVSQYLMDDMKKYRCEMILGHNTDTLDRWGTVINSRPVTVGEEDIRKAFQQFRGEVLQIPPMYSALKQNGKKLYELAREGKTVDREARKIFIEEIDILRVAGDTILFDVVCSKGTYVRTLCEDIGNYLECGGYMSFLLRTGSGRFNLANAMTLETLQKVETEKIKSEYLFDVDYPLTHMSRIDVRTSSLKYLLNGNHIYRKNMVGNPQLIEDAMVRLYVDNRFIALGRVKRDSDLYIDIDRVFN